MPDVATRFRWVQCQLDRLDQCRSAGDIQEALHSLPSGLFETYDRILLAIDEKEFDGRVVRRVLMWLVAALRPLHLFELAEALRIDLFKPILNDSIAPIHQDDILEICGSLVSYNEDSKEVVLSHYSVKASLNWKI